MMKTFFEKKLVRPKKDRRNQYMEIIKRFRMRSAGQRKHSGTMPAKHRRTNGPLGTALVRFDRSVNRNKITKDIAAGQLILTDLDTVIARKGVE